MLCSASLDIVVSHIAKKLKVEYIASELEFNNEICTGKIIKDLLGIKDKIIDAQKIELVVTDNTSDLELIMKSPKSVILSTSKNFNFWKRNGFAIDYILRD